MKSRFFKLMYILIWRHALQLLTLGCEKLGNRFLVYCKKEFLKGDAVSKSCEALIIYNGELPYLNRTLRQNWLVHRNYESTGRLQNSVNMTIKWFYLKVHY